MTLHIKQGAASAAPIFNATTWLASLTKIGGGYVQSGGGQLHFLTANCDGGKLESVMALLVGQPDYPDRIAAIKAAIERRQAGEVDA